MSVHDQGVPVYGVKREDGKPGIRTLHRNMLLPISFVPPVTPGQTEPTSRTPQTRARQKATGNSSAQQSSESSSSSESESENRQVYVIPARRRPENQGIQTDSVARVYSHSDTQGLNSFSSLDYAMHSDPPSATPVNTQSYLSTTPLSATTQSYLPTTLSPATTQSNLSNAPSSATSQSPLSNIPTTDSTQDSIHLPVEPSTAAPVIRQSSRIRRPPDRYGQWLYPQNNCQSAEYFV